MHKTSIPNTLQKKVDKISPLPPHASTIQITTNVQAATCAAFTTSAAGNKDDMEIPVHIDLTLQ